MFCHSASTLSNIIHSIFGEWQARHLWMAVRDDNVDKVKSLLKQGANPNHQLYEEDEWCELPPLHTACRKGNYAIAKALVRKGANVGTKLRRSEMVPLHFACYSGNLKIVKLLVEHGGRAYVNQYGYRYDYPPYYYDHYHGYYGSMASFRVTPLYFACERGHKEVVDYLIREVQCSMCKYALMSTLLCQPDNKHFKAYFKSVIIVLQNGMDSSKCYFTNSK